MMYNFLFWNDEFRKRKIHYLISIILLLFSILASPLLGQTFREVDFEKLILNHPMMKNYDSKTGYFKNSSYMLYDVNELKKQVAELEDKLNQLKEKENNLSNHSAEVEEEEEENFWNNVSNNSNQVTDIENLIIQKNELINNNGDPGYQYLYEIVSSITADVLLPLYKKDEIVLNKLPKYYSLKPNIGFSFNARDLLNAKNEEEIKDYIEKTRPFASIFPDSNKTILYNSNKVIDYNKVGTIDMTLALMLHPKMAHFNFMNLGFNKYKLGLEKEDYENFIEKIKSEAPDRSNELKNLKNELYELSLQKTRYYNNGDKTNGKFLDNMKLFSKKENDLKKRIFDVEYSINKPYMTEPNETIKNFYEIYDELDKTIQEVKKENNLDLILNVSLPQNFDYNINYVATSMKGLGHAGINYILFYTFFNDNHLKGIFNKNIEDYQSRRWFGLIQNDTNQNYFLPLRPHPMVLTGGKNILKDVVKIYYKKYDIDSSAYKVIESIISKIESYQQGKNY